MDALFLSVVDGAADRIEWTAPISAHLMAKAALSLRMDERPQLPGVLDQDTHVPPRPDGAPENLDY